MNYSEVPDFITKELIDINTALGIFSLKERKDPNNVFGNLYSVPGLGRSHGGGHYYCLENPHGQRSWAGYSPWGCKELDMAE